MTATTVGCRRITHELLADAAGSFRAVVSATEPGVVAGIDLLAPESVGEPVGTWRPLVADGARVGAGVPLVEIEGTAVELALAGDHVLGALGLASGIARRALAVVAAAPAGLSIACGAWKKLPAAVKPAVRAGLTVAGVSHRLVDGRFVYVDKNAVALLGGVEPATCRAVALDHGPVAVQVATPADALAVVAAGGSIVMVDTGELGTLRAVHQALVRTSLRDTVRLAFGNGVEPADLDAVREAGADIADIGRAILEAPLWDLHLEVTGEVTGTLLPNVSFPDAPHLAPRGRR